MDSINTEPTSSSGSDNNIDYDSDYSQDVYKLSRSDSKQSVSSMSSFVHLDKIQFLDLFNDPLISITNDTKKKINDMKMKTSKIRNRIMDKRMKIIKDPIFIKYQMKLSSKLNSLDKRLNQNLNASATEKLFYAFSIFQIFTAGYIIGKYPHWFHVYYTVLFTMLMPIRLYTYYKRSYQYFLADLCYYVNVLLIIYIWIFPYSEHLFISVFSLSLGTLSWAVITWRNSLVLHSIEKTTSSFIHVIPPVVVYVITHQLPHQYKEFRFSGAAKVTNWNFISGILWTSLYYSIWQLSYHYFITIKRADKIKNGRLTSFEWLRKSNAKNRIGRFVNSLPPPFDVLCFTLIQFSYQLLTMMFCPIWFKYKHCCSVFTTFIFIWASYNGATYYIDVFGKKFEKEVDNLKKEIVELQLQLQIDQLNKEKDELAAACENSNKDDLIVDQSTTSLTNHNIDADKDVLEI